MEEYVQTPLNLLKFTIDEVCFFCVTRIFRYVMFEETIRPPSMRLQSKSIKTEVAQWHRRKRPESKSAG